MEVHTAQKNEDQCQHVWVIQVEAKWRGRGGGNKTKNHKAIIPCPLCSPCLSSSYPDGNLGHTVCH